MCFMLFKLNNHAFLKLVNVGIFKGMLVMILKYIIMLCNLSPAWLFTYNFPPQIFLPTISHVIDFYPQSPTFHNLPPQSFLPTISHIIFHPQSPASQLFSPTISHLTVIFTHNLPPHMFCIHNLPSQFTHNLPPQMFYSQSPISLIFYPQSPTY